MTLSRRMRQIILSRIMHERQIVDAARAQHVSEDPELYGGFDPHSTDMNLPTLVVERTEIYPRADKWGNIGEIEVTYSTRGYRAIYGFTSLGVVTIYAD